MTDFYPAISSQMTPMNKPTLKLMIETTASASG
jgi:hypothetical protein